MNINIGYNFIIIILLILLIYLLIHTVFIGFGKCFSIMIVLSDSMKPVFKRGDRLLILHSGYHLFLKRGQIVVFSLSSTFNKPIINSDLSNAITPLFVKRLVGLGGDTHIPQVTLTEAIPEGYIFVMGDHPASQDSRYWGPIPSSSIRGIVVTRIGTTANSHQIS